MADYDLTTVSAVKEMIQTPDGYANLDALLPDLISEASIAIMNWTKREFAPVAAATTRRFAVTDYRCDLTPYDLQPTPVPTVVLHPETDQPYVLDTSQYVLKPVNPQRGVHQAIQFSGFLVIISQTLMAFGHALLDVTGTWGFPEIPDDVVRAANVTVASWVTRTAPGVSGTYGIPMSSGQGAMTYRNDWDIPWAACKLLSRYRRGSARWAS